MKQYIGGFSELELCPRPGPGYHAEALALHTARACVSHLIAQALVRRVWLPYYTCDALLEPFELTQVPYQFYALTAALEVAGALPTLQEGEYFVYVNYFGLKNEYVHHLAGHYGDRLVVDNTQDFFARRYRSGWAFNSARKSFGVPDGGYLYGPAARLGTATGYPVNTGYQATHLIDRLRGAQQAAYEGFVAYEHTLTSQPLQISELAASLLSQVDYEAVRARRRENFRRYHSQLAEFNTLAIGLSLDELPGDTVPFCYPLVPARGEQLDRRELFKQQIFVATLWPDVLTRQAVGFEWERQLTRALLPLPLDHRYGFEEVDKVSAAVKKLL